MTPGELNLWICFAGGIASIISWFLIFYLIRPNNEKEFFLDPEFYLVAGATWPLFLPMAILILIFLTVRRLLFGPSSAPSSDPPNADQDPPMIDPRRDLEWGYAIGLYSVVK